MAPFLGLIITLFYFFVKDREKRVKRWERLEKEKIQSQFETLKSQVNPHFLFNSFNTLISVIEDDQEKAVEYVEHLSDLYRKIVTYRDKDVITLKEEIDIIKIIFTFRENDLEKPSSYKSYFSKRSTNMFHCSTYTSIANRKCGKAQCNISRNTINNKMNIEDDLLVVSNNINLKVTNETGAGMGLQNIQKRYKLLSNVKLSLTKH